MAGPRPVGFGGLIFSGVCSIILSVFFSSLVFHAAREGTLGMSTTVVGTVGLLAGGVSLILGGVLQKTLIVWIGYGVSVGGGIVAVLFPMLRAMFSTNIYTDRNKAALQNTLFLVLNFMVTLYFCETYFVLEFTRAAAKEPEPQGFGIGGMKNPSGSNPQDNVDGDGAQLKDKGN